MDPYLEHPDLWPDVHNRLLGALADHLGPRLRPHYWARLEERTYLADPEALALVGRPDVAVGGGGTQTTSIMRERASAGSVTVEVPVPDRVRELYLEVRSAPSGEVVTVLELLSPANKRAGKGRRLYERKRLTTLGTRTHLVELDLLRGGMPMTVGGLDSDPDYRILVSRSEQRPRAQLVPFSVRSPIPPLALPLRGPDEDLVVDLNGLLHGLYDRAAYDLTVNYRGEPVPPLTGADHTWMDALLHAAGLR